jgi:hypothetical protein
VRYVLARDAKLLNRALGIFVSEIVRHLKRKSGHRPRRDILTGAVTGIQRYGGAINLNPHLHTMALDGVYIRDEEEGTLTWKSLPEPTDDELHEVLDRTRKRIRDFLVRKGFTAFAPDPTEEGQDPPEADLEEPSLFDTVQSSSILEELLLSGSPRRVPMPGRRPMPYLPRPDKPLCVSVDGWSLEAGVRIRKGDREGLERLCRYVTRPPLSQERLELLPDGRVRYGFRRPRPDGSTHLILTPLEFLEKLAAIVPPPYHHLTVYHGILAPNSRTRKLVVPQAAPAPPPESCAPVPCEHPPKEPRRRRESKDEPPSHIQPEPELPRDELRALPVGELVREARRSRDAPVGPGRSSWATLLKRAFALDVLQCPTCKGRREVIAAITEPEAIRKILRCLGHPEDPPRAAPARPLGDPGFEFDQAS